ncbi:type II toxin-antitoxin system PemK/MazF family toxin [Streptomyces sp. NPDC057927]
MLKCGDVNTIKRGDVYFVDIPVGVGSEQSGKRPVVIIQNDIGNKFSPTVIVTYVTSKLAKKKLPTHVELSPEESGLTRGSVVLGEQVRTIDKSRLIKKITSLSDEKMEEITNAISISMGIGMNTPVNREKLVV